MEKSIRRRHLNAVPILSLMLIVLLDVFGDNYLSIPAAVQFILIGILALLNMAVLVIRYRLDKVQMKPKLIILMAFLLVSMGMVYYYLRV